MMFIRGSYVYTVYRTRTRVLLYLYDGTTTIIILMIFGESTKTVMLFNSFNISQKVNTN